MQTKITDEKKLEIALAYQQGQSAVQIAKRYGCSSTVVYRALKLLKVPRRTGGHQPPTFKENHFDQIDTESKAYFLGLIIADGSVCQPNKGGQKIFQIELLEQDKELIIQLCQQLQYPVSRIKTYQRKGRSATTKVCITSNRLAQSLSEYGVIANKAAYTKLPKLNKNLMRHFLRGLYDGDGSIAKYRLVLTAGNTVILNQVRDHLVNALDLNPEAIKIYKTGERAWALSVNRKLERQSVMKYLYYDASVSMQRKARWLGN